jgi:hypothetical protein
MVIDHKSIIVEGVLGLGKTSEKNTGAVAKGDFRRG